MPPANHVLTLSKATWCTLLGLCASVVGSIWTFTITVSGDIRELKTDIKAVHSATHGLETRLGRIEAVYIKPN